MVYLAYARIIAIIVVLSISYGLCHTKTGGLGQRGRLQSDIGLHKDSYVIEFVYMKNHILDFSRPILQSDIGLHRSRYRHLPFFYDTIS